MIDGIEPSQHHNVLQGGEDNFDKVLEESEEELARIARKHHSRSVKDSILELDDISLTDRKINDDPTFNKLKVFLKNFTIQAQEAIQEKNTHTIKDYSYQTRIHDCLRFMMREVVQTDDVERKKLYLMRVYKWYMNKMNAIGAISITQKQKEDAFMHPDVHAEAERKKKEQEEMMKARLKDEAYNQEVQKGFFQAGERTIHKDIIPARERIEFYKRRLPKDPNSSSILETTSTRPNTKSSTRVRTANTRSDTMYGQNFRPSFHTFFTSGEKVEFDSVLKVESKANYGSYIPADNIVEQKLQKMWTQTQNREVAEKRVNDELKQTMQDWGNAKARYEEDIQRKIENRLYGSNFGARAFIRKPRPKIDYHRNHLDDSDGSSLLSDSEIEELERIATQEGEDDGEGEEEFKDKVHVARPHVGTNFRKQQDVRIRKGRSHTAIRTKRKPPIPKLIDKSVDEGEKL